MIAVSTLALAIVTKIKRSYTNSTSNDIGRSVIFTMGAELLSYILQSDQIKNLTSNSRITSNILNFYTNHS